MRRYAFLVAALIAGACSSTGSKGQKELEGLTGEITKLSEQLAEGKTDLQNTIAQHDAIANNTDGDFVGHYKKYAKGIERVEKDRDGIRERVQKVKDAAAPYFTRWKEDNAKITDPGLRATDMSNLGATQARYDEIHKAGEGAKAAYEPLMQTLKDHRQFWSNNLNATSAGEMKKDSEKLDGEAKKLYGLIDNVVETAKKYNESVEMRVKK